MPTTFGRLLTAEQGKPFPEARGEILYGAVDEREPGDLHGVVQLGLLDRRVLGVLAVRLDGVGAVAPVRPPYPPASAS